MTQTMADTVNEQIFLDGNDYIEVLGDKAGVELYAIHGKSVTDHVVTPRQARRLAQLLLAAADAAEDA